MQAKMDAKLSPIVFWGQNKEKVFLKVDLKEARDQNIELNEYDLSFSADGLGAHGRHHYYFAFNFFSPIDTDLSTYKVTERLVEFKLQKAHRSEAWPRLTESTAKPGWLKIDFDHFQFEDDDSDDEAAAGDPSQQKMFDQLHDGFKYNEDDDVSLLEYSRQIYLVLFNLFQWVGYSYIFFWICYRYWRDGADSKTSTYEEVAGHLMMVQLTAILEVLHAAVGFVKSPILLPLIQVMGRNFVLFGLLAQEERLQERHIVWFLFLAWTCVEVFRYPYYILSLLNWELKIVTWLRYSVWIPLYPAGFMAEGFVMLLSLPYFEQTGKWSYSLPNSLNIGVHFPTLLRVYMLAFLPGMYILMTRMYNQRKRKLGRNPKVISTKFKVS